MTVTATSEQAGPKVAGAATANKLHQPPHGESFTELEGGKGVGPGRERKGMVLGEDGWWWTALAKLAEESGAGDNASGVRGEGGGLGGVGRSVRGTEVHRGSFLDVTTPQGRLQGTRYGPSM